MSGSRDDSRSGNAFGDDDLEVDGDRNETTLGGLICGCVVVSKHHPTTSHCQRLDEIRLLPPDPRRRMVFHITVKTMYHRRRQIGHRPASGAHGSPRLRDDEPNALSTCWQMSPTVPQRPAPIARNRTKYDCSLLTPRRRMVFHITVKTMYHRRPQIGHRPASRALPPCHGSPRQPVTLGLPEPFYLASKATHDVSTSVKPV